MKTAKGFSPKTKILSLILSFLIIFYLVPASVFAEGLDGEANALDNSVSETLENNTYTQKIYEVTELREENVKHFRLEDGSYVAAQYNYPVHYTDGDGQLADIDNRLIDSGSEFSTNNSRVKFIKKITGNGNLFTLHENNTKITMGLVGAEKKTEGVVTSTHNSDEGIEDALGRAANLENISSTILYEDILDGVDIEYIVHSLNIKENIIVKEKKTNYSYTFTLELNNLTAALDENGNVYINSLGGETQYVIPAPIVFDANGVYAPKNTSEYALSEAENGKYELNVTVDSSWMNSEDRVFPVTIDPPMMCTNTDALDLSIDRNSPNGNDNGGNDFYVSSSKRSYIKFNENYLADIPIGATLIKAELSIYGRKSNSAPITKVGVYEITTNWDDSLTWNKTLSPESKGVFGNILDYLCVDASGRYSWEITRLYKSWISGASNYGVGLKLLDETSNESAYFTSSEYFYDAENAEPFLPVIMATYIYNDGLEDYYPTATHSVGVGGAGSINLSTGRLALAIPTLTTTDYLFAFTPTLVYNSSLAGKAATSENVGSAFSTSYTPNGFKLNINETIISSYYYDAEDNFHRYYILYDADGSTHCFYYNENDDVYYDDDGLQLTLNVETNVITIEDINHNIKTYAKINGSSWYLSSIKDKFGNKLIFIINTAYQPVMIYVKPNGQENIQMLDIVYDGDKICAIYNDSSKDSVIFGYSGNNLSTVKYCYGNANTTKQNVKDAYNNPSTAQNVTVYATATYTYDSNGHITEITDSNANKSLKYEITDGKITKLSEYAGEALGQQISYTYGEGYTDVRSTGNDETLNTADDIITRYIFDAYGRTVSVYSMSSDGENIYGATSGSYDDSEKSKNSIKSNAVLGGINPFNIITNGSSTDGHFATIQGGIDKNEETGCYKQTVFLENNVATLTSSNSNVEYIISGFGYANSILQNEFSDFSIGVNVYYYQGTGKEDEVVKYRFSFTDVENAWQYACGKFYCKLAPTENANYDYVRKIEVVCSYYGHLDVESGAAYAYFDDIALTQFTDSNGFNYFYDSDSGNLVYKENSLYQEWYEYDDKNRIERIENNYGEIYQYIYNKDETTGESDTYEFYIKKDSQGEETLIFARIFCYNKYGLLTNNIQLDIEGEDYTTDTFESEKMGTAYSYKIESGSKIFGALISETDSRGNITHYSYNELNGRLNRQYDASLGTGYYYFYDSDGSLKMVLPSPIEEDSEQVHYNYNSAGELSSIGTQGTTYSFAYDSFGNSIGVTAGDKTLATYEYYPNNGKIKKINYGNGFSEEYAYNTLELLSEICYTYDDGTTVTAYSYTYNHDGTLSELTNHIEETVVEYCYDNRGRIISITERDIDGVGDNSRYSVAYNFEGKICSTSNIISYAFPNSGISTLFTTSFKYGLNGGVSCETHKYLSDDHKISYQYDNFNRISSVSRDFDAFDQTITYSYLNDYEDGRENRNTSYLVDSYTSTIGSSSTTYNYSYDPRGNITLIEKGDVETTYTYDDLGQLTQESNGTTVRRYTYDKAGNIVSIKSEPVSTDDDGLIIRAALALPSILPLEKILTYTDSEWGDQLTSFAGHTIIYDEIGNPISYYNGTAYTFDWTGRQLTTAVRGTTNMSFTYNDSGIRTSKTVNGVKHTYKLNGSQIVSEEWEDKLLIYLYDSTGMPIGMMYRTASYAKGEFDVFWYEKNLQGDIVAIYNESGTKVATYTYSDAWGNHSVTYSNGGGSTGAQYNPFRYRGYYYDTDLGMYYLQSRYYDAKICRFINADSALYHSMLGYNLYAYCENNPVIMIDITGQYCVAIMDDDGNLLNDWILEGASSGGYKAAGNYVGPGSSYYNYSVRSLTAAYDARLGGYHSNSVSSGITNTGYYFVPGAVSVTDDMAAQNNIKYTPPKGGGGSTSKININGVEVDFGHGGRHLSSTDLSISDVENAIAKDVITRSHTNGVVKHGTVTVNGIDIFYNYYTRDTNWINVGTYYPVK